MAGAERQFSSAGGDGSAAERVRPIIYRVLAITALPVAFQILILISLQLQLRAQWRDRELQLQSKDVIATSGRILRLLVDVETAVRGYAVTRNGVFNEPYDNAVRLLPGEFAALRRFAPGSRNTIDVLEMRAARVLRINRRQRELVESGDVAAAVHLIEAQLGKQAMDEFRVTMANFITAQRALDATRNTSAHRSQRAAMTVLAIGFALNVVVAAAAATLFTRNVTRRIGVIVENTRKFEAGEIVDAPPQGRDEIALLERRFHAMAAAMREARLELERSNGELEAFSYSVSHDLRAPLRAIDGYTQMIEEDYGAHFDAEGKRFLSVVRNEAKRMGTLIDDLLAFSRLGRQALTVERVDMTSLVREVFAEVMQPVTRPVRLQLDELPPSRGDRRLLRYAITNLIDNAVKFSARVEDAVVIVSGVQQGPLNTYCVRDRGAGFDDRYIDKLFGVFHRLHRDDEFPGTGVGLAIVRRVIERHGGEIRAESKLGEGATFYFTLPSAQGDAFSGTT